MMLVCFAPFSPCGRRVGDEGVVANHTLTLPLSQREREQSHGRVDSNIER